MGADGSQAPVADDLSSERDEAWAHARALEHELGAARGRIKRLELVLYRRTRRREYAAGWVRRWRAATVDRLRSP